MVKLADQPPTTRAGALDHPHLPQRPAAVKRLRHHPSDQGSQLPRAAGAWQRGVAQVIGQLEVRILHPHRPAKPPRHPAHTLAVAPQQRELTHKDLGELARGRRRTLEQRHRAEMHMAHVILEVQEQRVQPAHSLHRRAPLPEHRTLPTRGQTEPGAPREHRWSRLRQLRIASCSPPGHTITSRPAASTPLTGSRKARSTPFARK